jgi:hypothetical protein
LSEKTSSNFFNTRDFFTAVVVLQYVPRILRIHRSRKILTGSGLKRVRIVPAEAAFNLFLYILASHVSLIINFIFVFCFLFFFYFPKKQNVYEIFPHLEFSIAYFNYAFISVRLLSRSSLFFFFFFFLRENILYLLKNPPICILVSNVHKICSRPHNLANFGK